MPKIEPETHLGRKKKSHQEFPGDPVKNTTPSYRATRRSLPSSGSEAWAASDPLSLLARESGSGPWSSWYLSLPTVRWLWGAGPAGFKTSLCCLALKPQSSHVAGETCESFYNCLQEIPPRGLTGRALCVLSALCNDSLLYSSRGLLSLQHKALVTQFLVSARDEKAVDEMNYPYTSLIKNHWFF